MLIALIFGGVAPKPQVKALAEGVDIIVATPGRLLEGRSCLPFWDQISYGARTRRIRFRLMLTYWLPRFPQFCTSNRVTAIAIGWGTTACIAVLRTPMERNVPPV